MQVTAIIILSLILVILLLIIGIYFYAKEKVSNFSKQIFGTSNIIEGFKKQEIEYAETPKSVASMDSVTIPKITKDFPNLDINELKRTAENAIIQYYNSLEKRECLEIKKASEKLKNKIQSDIEDLPSYDIHYDNIEFQRTVINTYTNKKGLCTITTQSSFSYKKKWKDTEQKIQMRMNVEFIYIYDEKEVEGTYGISLNCKNCGAPIKTLGDKYCPYCGTGVIELATKTWQINDLYQK